MAVGLTIQRSSKGLPLSGSVNFREYPEMLPIFEEKEKERKKRDPKNPAVSGILPRGYITVEQFASDAKKLIEEYCDAHDIR